MTLLHFPKDSWPLLRKWRDLLRSGASSSERVWWLAFHMAKQGWSRGQIRDALLDPANSGGGWLRACADPEAVLLRLVESIDWSYRPSLPTKERQRRIRLLLRANGPMSQNALIAAVGHANSGHVRGDLRSLAKAGVVRITAVPHGKVSWYTVELLLPDHGAEERELEIRQRMARAIARREVVQPANVHKAYGHKGEVSSRIDDDGEDFPHGASVAAASASRPTMAEMLRAGRDACLRVKRPDFTIDTGWLEEADVGCLWPDAESPDVDPPLPWSREEREAACNEFIAWCESNTAPPGLPSSEPINATPDRRALST